MGLFSRRKKDLFTIPEPSLAAPFPSPATGDFRLVVADVFVIKGRGVVVTGTVEAGAIGVGSRVSLERAGQTLRAVEIGAIEQFRKRCKQASAGENVGLLLRDLTMDDLTMDDVASGDVLRG